ncbi:MAG: TetR/AcrR family transcriptional regulator [Rhodospirillaceae bacterium]|nr:TetR/AcrR family transcriptional regulator [Rhodospirillaceae bacterium]
MRARSTKLKQDKKSLSKAPAKRAKRMPHAERREQILTQAAEFFSEYGLTGQTRSLAAACGISQRLLYRFFPTKAALLAEVYARTILGPFEGEWFGDLTNRDKSMETRLIEFYSDYYEKLLTRRWLRLFLYSALAEGDMAPNYISSIITKLLDTIVDEAALELKISPPENPDFKRELGWTLHGAISHLAIRRHIYHGPHKIPHTDMIKVYVQTFLAGLPITTKHGAD